MRGRVVARDARAALGVHRRRHRIAHGKRAFRHRHLVRHKALLGRLGVAHFGDGPSGAQRAGVAHLAAHLGIERRRVQNDLARLACGKRLHARAVLHDGRHARLGFQLVVAHERRGAQLLQKLGVHAAVGAPRGLGVLRVRSAGALALLVHTAREAVHIHRDAALLAQLAGHLHGEAVRVVQRERLLAGQRGAGKGGQRLVQKRAALPQRGAEALLLGQDHATRQLAVLHDLGIHMPHEAHDLVHVVVEERLVEAQQVPLHHGAAQQAAQHVAAALVRR